MTNTDHKSTFALVKDRKPGLYKPEELSGRQLTYEEKLRDWERWHKTYPGIPKPKREGAR